MKYDKLFTMMKAKNLSSYRIRKERIISEKTLQHLREGKSVETDALCKLCRELKCQPGEIMEYVDD